MSGTGITDGIPSWAFSVFADWLECSFSGIYTAPCGFARKFRLFDQRAVFPVWLCLFLFIISFIRDTLWMVIDLIRRAPVEEMKNPPLLQKVNIITFVFCLLFCFYGVYEAEKIRQLKHMT